MGKLNVDGTEIQVLQIEEDDYISLTDMVRKIDNGPALIEKWLRNKNTIEFLGIWEEMYNADFNAAAYEEIMLEAGLNRFIMSVKQWVSRTNSKGIVAKAGRYGGTYAYKDIAFEFASWVSPQFKLYLIKEFERLKKEEQALLGWSAKRELAKINYRIHTDAIKDFIIPKVEDFNQKLVYADEADLLNLALWGCTARQWREANPQYADKNINIRDVASINELVVLSNMESFNAELIKRKVDKSKRFTHLRQMAKEQLAHLNTIDTEKKFRILTDNDKQLE